MSKPLQTSQSRRDFLKHSALGALGLAVAGLASCATQRRPNIIFLLTDDQRWDTLGIVNPHIQTPHMDQLARDGVMFENAFVTTAICMTSRASIFLGQYARRHGINDFGTDFTPEQLANTYPLQLKSAGYRIGFIGKYGVGSNLPEDEYDYWRGVPGQPTYETTDETGEPVHCTRLFGNQAIDFMQNASPEQPFCLSISFKAPHVQDGDPRQFIPDPAYDDMYRDVTIPKPETATESHRQRLPEFLKSEKAMMRVRWRLRFENSELYQKSLKNHHRLIYGVDEVLGRIRTELEERGLADDTVIALLGDNGFFLGEYGFAGKWLGYEPSIRVPLVIYDPRLPKSQRGQVRSEMALNIDMAPTFLEYAGLTPPAGTQGKSLLPLVRGESIDWRRDFLYEHTFRVPEAARERVGYIPASIGVRTERFKYLRYFEQDPVYEQLFDLQADPHEEHNLVDSEAHQEVLERLRKRCEKLQHECQ